MEDVASALARLPIFPLPRVALFPGALLPLHVFEPRYLAMIEDVLGGNKLLGIARLAPGYEAEYDGRPNVLEIAGLGEIVDSHRLPDGRYGILLRGRERIRIERELPADKLYREVEATVVDGRTSAGSTEDAQTRLMALCEQLAQQLEAGGDKLRALVRANPHPADLSDALAAGLVTDAERRQTLLATVDPGLRLGVLSDLVAHLLVELGPRSAMPN